MLCAILGDRKCGLKNAQDVRLAAPVVCVQIAHGSWIANGLLSFFCRACKCVFVAFEGFIGSLCVACFMCIIDHMCSERNRERYARFAKSFLW